MTVSVIVVTEYNTRRLSRPRSLSGPMSPIVERATPKCDPPLPPRRGNQPAAASSMMSP